MEGKWQNWEKWKNVPGINKTKALTKVAAGMVLSRELSSAAAVLLARKVTPPRITCTTSRSF
jgi:hypothetical protein